MFLGDKLEVTSNYLIIVTGINVRETGREKQNLW